MVEYEDASDMIAEVLAHRVIPLFIPIGREGLTLVGTGFMVVFNEENYLVTAAHVVRGEIGSVDEFLPIVAFLGDGPQITLQRIFVTERDPITGEDEIDIAVSKISPLIGMPPYKKQEKEAFDISDLVQGQVPRDQKFYALAGYPETKNRIKYNSGAVQSRPYIYLDRSADAESYLRKGLDQRRNLLIKHIREGGVGNVGEDFRFPELKGMSGGPILIFRPSYEKESEIEFDVVGVTKSHLVHDGMIKGTEIGFARQMILKYDDFATKGLSSIRLHDAIFDLRT